MRKKSIRMLSLLLCSVLLLGFSVDSLAAANQTVEEIIQIDVPVDTLNPDDFVEANKQLVARGQAAMQQRSGKTLTVEHYYQSGEVWSSDIMQTQGKTIQNAGCCLTSFAMIQRYLGGIYNPRGVNQQMGNSACPFDYSIAENVFGLTISNYKRGIVTDSYAKEFIIGAIDSGYPVLIGMTPDDTTKNTHFVTAYGYYGDIIFIHDPASSRDYMTLTTYLNDYSVHRLYVYTK